LKTFKKLKKGMTKYEISICFGYQYLAYLARYICDRHAFTKFCKVIPFRP